MTTVIAHNVSSPPVSTGSDRIVRLLDCALIYGTIILIPYDLPLIHQAFVPLAGIGVLLMIARGDLGPFLAFMRRLPVPALLTLMICALAVLSLYSNINAILDSTFQGENGWTRGLEQSLLLFISMAYPFYLAFCLRRHPDWKSLIIRAAWWSLPVPMFVGFLQLANVAGIHGFAHLPYVGGAYEGGFFRLTSVARESSWFGSFACVILPFLIMSRVQTKSAWRKWAASATIGNLLLFVVFGLSKSALAALATEIAVGGLILLIAYRPMRTIGKFFFGLIVIVTVLFATAVLSPAAFTKVTEPFVNKAIFAYQLFEPLLNQDKQFISISTRFGMSSAGVSMGQEHPFVGVGLGQFGFNVYNYIPLWGLNRETLSWLSNDTKGWPSTSNLYTRLLAEIGGPGFAAYLAFRLVLLLGVGARLLRKDSGTWSRDLAVFSIMSALIAFDFHRDSFINLDMWAALGMALACMDETVAARQGATRGIVSAQRTWPLFGVVAAVSFCVVMGLILSRPVSYQASATVLPKSGGIVISASEGLDDSGTSVLQGGDQDAHFKLLRVFWASRTVAARIIAAHPDLVRAVLKTDEPVTPSVLADYIKWNVTVLMEDDQTTLTFQYRNPDPKLADRFLVAAIDETDHAIAAVSTASGAQAAQLSQLIIAKKLDIATSQDLLAQSAARELQSGFDVASQNTSFDYVEHPAVSALAFSPQPAIALLFAFLLAGLTAAVTATMRLLWPAFVWRSYT